MENLPALAPKDLMGDLLALTPEGTIVVNEEAAVEFIERTPLEGVEAVEDGMVAADLNEAEELNSVCLRVKLTAGLFARALIIPKGTFLTGRIHKRPYIDIFIYGDVTVKSFLSDGTFEAAERISNFRFFEGVAGRKRVLIAHENTLWVTVDPTTAEHIHDAQDDITVFQMHEYHKELGGM